MSRPIWLLLLVMLVVALAAMWADMLLKGSL